MHIWVDADACLAVIKDILFRAAERTRRPMTIRALQVPRGIDVADSHSKAMDRTECAAAA